MKEPAKKTCFVIMPFSDMVGYEPGHFSRVYKHLVKPACIAAGLEPVRGDEVIGTNYIAIDILQRILKSDIVICDLSGKNANVMYELGVRQAFDLPVVLLKDKRTERVFDIQGLRTLDYEESLRIDAIEQNRKALSQAIEATMNLELHEVNSLVSLLAVEKASLGKPTEVSPDTALVLASLKDISTRLAIVEESSIRRQPTASMSKIAWRQLRSTPEKVVLPNGETLNVGEMVFDMSSGTRNPLGILVSGDKDAIKLRNDDGLLVVLSTSDPRYSKLSDIPF